MKSSERQKQTEAVNIRTGELWQSGGIHKYEVMLRGFSKQISNRLTNSSTVCLTIKVRQVTPCGVSRPMWKRTIQMTTGV